jgi:cytochrome c553
MKANYLPGLALLAASVLPISGFAAGDAAAGKIKAFTCMGCHGIPGYNNVYPTYHVPKLGGQHADYIVAALQAYKSGQRNHGTMHAQATTLSDQDMQDIAAFFEQGGK